MNLATPSIVARFGNYSMQARMATIGACDLWRVEQTNSESTGRGALLYKLRPEWAQDQGVMESFVTEGRRAVRLRQPNIAITHDVLVDRNDIGIVAELVPGPSVRSIVEQVKKCQNAIPVWFAMHVTSKLCAALCYAHSAHDAAGILDPNYHQAIDSDRVVITTNGVVKVTEFGLGHVLAQRESTFKSERSTSASGQFSLETPPPTQSCIQADIAGAAWVLYELLTLIGNASDPLPRADGFRPIARTFVPPSHFAPWVPRGVDDTLARALVLNCRDGFTQVSQFADALDEYLATKQPVHAEHVAAFLNVLALSEGQTAPHQENGVQTALGQLTLVRRPSPQQLEGPTDNHTAAPSARGAPQRPSVPPNPSNGHNWDEAIASARRCYECAESYSDDASQDQKHLGDLAVSDGSALATTAFEEGLQRLRLGDPTGAESAWKRALQFDSSHRAALTNLKLLKKRAEYARPQA